METIKIIAIVLAAVAAYCLLVTLFLRLLLRAVKRSEEIDRKAKELKEQAALHAGEAAAKKP